VCAARLGRAPRGAAEFRAGVARLLRGQLELMLRVIALESRGAIVRPQGFRLGGAPAAPAPAGGARGKFLRGFQHLGSYQFLEPRLLMMGRILECVRRMGVFLQAEGPVTVDGFRLRNLRYWARYHCETVVGCLGCLSGYCNARCEFCFRYGSMFQRFPHRLLSRAEAETRLKYYDPAAKKGLPYPVDDTGEIFLNRDLLEILRAARARDPEALIDDLTTHGNFLDQATVARLAQLKPVFVVISLNSANPELRARLMRGGRDEVGIRAFSLLRENGIPFIGSVVPWPSIPLEDVEASLRFLDREQAYLIRVCLPSFTRHSHPVAPFQGWEHWEKLGALIERVRPELATPLLVQPSWYLRREIRAHVDGVIRNSPAFGAGLRFGDVILAVEGKAVLTRQDAAAELVRRHREGRAVRLRIARDGRQLSLRLAPDGRPEEDRYPYKPAGYRPDPRMLFGIHFIDPFPVESVLAMARILREHPEARRILVLTTVLGEGLFRKVLGLLGQSPEFALPLERIRLSVPPHRHLGGNIVVGDLHVVSDYIEHLRDLERLGYRPDLVLIPSSFTMGEWGLDALGRSYLEIERQTGCRVELVPTRPVKM